MAMNAGSVNAAGGGSGLAKEMFDDYEPKLGITPGPGAVAGKQQIADMCNSFAQTIIAHITANAVVSTSVAFPIPVTTAVVGSVGTGGTTAPGTGTGSVA